MGRFILIGAIVAILVVLAVIVVMGAMRARTGHSRAAVALSQADALRQLRLLDDAARLMSGMGIGMDPDRIDLLTDETRASVADWLVRYDRLRKDIDRG